MKQNLVVVTKEFSTLYKQEVEFVWNYLHRTGIPARDLEDAVHDVFVVVFKKYETFDPSKPRRPWLCGIAFRVASEYRRRACHRKEALLEDADSPPKGAIPVWVAGQESGERIERDNPELKLQQASAHELVMQALETLGEKQKNVFVLHDLEGYSIPEIETITQIPLNTLYSQLRAARKKFVASIRRQQKNRGEK